jgi:hypothetical protein
MKVAILLTGGVSLKNIPYCGSTWKEHINNNITNYINIQSVYLSIKKNIINCNPNCTFDIYIYSWNINIQNEIINIFNPIKSEFEDNDKYRDYISSFSGQYEVLSASLALKKGIELIESSNIKYDTIISTRPDCILWKELYLNKCDTLKIYTLNWNNANSDVFFIMNLANAIIFKNLFESSNMGNPAKSHYWIKNYIEKYMNQSLLELDDIYIGTHFEVLRKIHIQYLAKNISEIQLNEYGLTVSEILSYRL